MLPRRIASRYAEALFGLAQQHGKTDAWERELATLAAVIAATPELVTVLTHPEVPLARKREIIEHAFKEKISAEVLSTLLLLIRRGHEPDVAVLHEIYYALWDKARRVTPVMVTSAAPLTEQQTAALTGILTRQTGTTIQLRREVDPDLIAGMVITLGDRVIDASARTTLVELREAMRG